MDKEKEKYVNSVMNYTGSKFKLLEQIIPLLDFNKDNFVDIFAGGGSVWSNVADKYDKILVNDIIGDLVEIQKQLLFEPNKIISLTKQVIVSKEDKDGFLELRKSYNEQNSPEKLWALMLTSTNNMIRFNKKFKYNQTFGKRSWNNNTTKKVELYVKYISQFKNKIKFTSTSFQNIKITKPSMVYLDPPYLETEAGYNNYWSKLLDERLYEYIINLDKSGSSFALSGVLGEHKNGKRSELIDKLVKDFNHKILEHNYEKVSRNKNTKNSQEIIITNY